MKTKNNTVTIGLPIYNEGANIINLLKDLENQKITGSNISKIIISSDGSTDDTSKVLKGVRNKKIVFIENKDRKGIKRGLNQIIKRTKTDILVFLDGDIRIFDKKFVEKLINPIINGDADLTSCRISPQNSPNFFSKIIKISMEVKDILFDSYNRGDNVYTCHGPVRAHSKRLYKRLFFPMSVGNDMFSYFDCKVHGYSYKYIKSTVVYYKLVRTLPDHIKQGLRFGVAKKKQIKYFGTDIVNAAFKEPFSEIKRRWKSIVKKIISNPILSFSYLILSIYLSILSTHKKRIPEAWEISASSK